MSFEEEFDSIIRRKAEGETYPFDESNWEKTSALLDADRGASRALKIKQLYLPAILVLAIGAAGFMTYNYFDSVNGNKENAKQLAVVVKEKTIDSKNESPASEKINDLSAASSKETQEQKQETAPSVSEETTNNVKSDQNERLASSTKLNSLESNLTNEKADTRESSHVKAIQKESVLAKIKNTQNFNAATTSKQESSASSKDEKFASDVESESAQNTSAASKKEFKEAEVKEDPTAKNDFAATFSQDQGVVENENSNFVPQAAASESDLSVNAEKLNAVYSTLPSETTELDVRAGSFVYLERYDDDYYKKKNTKTHYLNLELGANYLLGWNANKGKDGQGLNWYAGFNYGRYLSTKFNVSIGLQAYNIANIKQPFYLVTSKEYGFGSNLVYTRVTSNQMYYVAVPLKFNYAVNSKNTIGLGVNAAYLIDATNTVSKYYILDNEVKNIGSSETHTKGIYKGTNTMNVMLSAHYKTQFGNRIGLNLEFNYGVSDMFKNTELVKTSEKPMGVRIGLTYTIFDK